MTYRPRAALAGQALLVLALGGVGSARAESPPVQTDADAVSACLATWGRHPFGDDPRPRYQVLSGGVRVFGIGQDINDDTATATPNLVLIKPAVNVLGKGTIRLMNPNGWYCFEAAVTVLAKSEVIAHCRARLASSVDGVAVAGGNDGTEGVTVLGKSVVTRVGCEPVPPRERLHEEPLPPAPPPARDGESVPPPIER